MIKKCSECDQKLPEKPVLERVSEWAHRDKESLYMVPRMSFLLIMTAMLLVSCCCLVEAGSFRS